MYVNDAMPGITRVRKGKGFAYLDDMRRRVDREHLSRIRKLAIPPAWTRVWICPLENGHIQATGYDVRSRKQYRYHSLWSEARNETKFLPVVRVRQGVARYSRKGGAGYGPP